jgi:hypothetical protein
MLFIILTNMCALRYYPNMQILSRTPLEPSPWQRSFAALAARNSGKQRKNSGRRAVFSTAEPSLAKHFRHLRDPKR